MPFRDALADLGDGSLISEVERAGLPGRGGAGFPAGRKMRAVAQAGRRAGPLRSPVGTVVIANGAESEPASVKDRMLLARAPHLVLDGIALAAEAVGASRAYLCVHDGEDDRPASSRAAISVRERAGLNRVPIQVPGDRRRLRGEPGDRAGRHDQRRRWRSPRSCRPGPPRRASRGRPTLVQNVETLAHVALIARYGAGWFGAMGTGRHARARPHWSPSAATVHRPGVYEIALGTPVGDLLRQAGGPTEAPAGDPGRRLLRRLDAATTGRSATSGSAIRRCARRARRSGPGFWCCCPRRRAGWPRPPGWSATWPRRARASAGPA